VRSSLFWCLIPVLWLNSLTSTAALPLPPKNMTCSQRIIYQGSALAITAGLSLRYKIETVFEPGAKEAITDPERGTLVVMNHPTWGVEATKVFAEVALLGVKPLIVIADSQIEGLVLGNLAKLFEVVAVPDMTKKNGDANVLKDATAKITAALNEKRLVVIAGAGRIYRSRTESMGSMVANVMATQPDVHVVTANAQGLWGSRLSMAGTGEYPAIGRVLLTGAAATVGNLGLNPRHPWTLTFSDRTQELTSVAPGQINENLNRIFNTSDRGESVPAMPVRHRLGWWDSTVAIPDPAISQVAGDIHSVPDDVRQATVDKLIEITGAQELKGLPLDSPALLNKHLRDSLGMDSLAATELLVWVEEYTLARTGTKFQADSTESILTVQDLMLAANGAAQVQGGTRLALPNRQWLTPPSSERMSYKWDGVPFTTKWLQTAINNPHGVTLAEPKMGTPTNRQILRMISAILPTIEAMEGDRVGVLLPAGVPVFAVIHAIRLAGKVPVLLNFTTSDEAIRTAVRTTGVKQVFTASLLLAKLKWGPEQAAKLGVQFVEFEKVAASLTLGAKAKLLFEYFFQAPRALLDRKMPKEAGILVTSGSTGIPKSIAITDEMLGLLVSGLLDAVDVKVGDRLLQTGPPFHILGYLAGVVLPSVAPIKVGLLPNPTDYPQMAAFLELFAINRAVSPPAFAEGVAVAAVPGQMDGLQLLVYGAQAMTTAQRQLITRRAAHTLILEAYGSTETTGALAFQPVGSGGWLQLLPTVEYKLLDIKTGQPLAAGGQGELYVRGPTIIESYVESRDPELSATSEAFVKIDGATYYRTGDLIEVNSQNLRWIRYITRVGRTYKVGGEFINPDSIENALGEAFPREASDPKGYLFAVTGAVQADGTAKTVLFTTRNLTVLEANQGAMARGLKPIERVHTVYRVDAIPMAGSGKVALSTISRWAAELENPDPSARSADLNKALAGAPR
jgi:long-chain-fatty-acid--[acyl-carrier-protein] ligase